MRNPARSPQQPEALREEILALVARYARLAHKPEPFVPDRPKVPVSGRVYGAPELQLLVEAALDFWLTAGPYAEDFEAGLARAVGVTHAVTCNSGSSANLLATGALTSPLLGTGALEPGDEVITCATGFPTTVNPIFQHGLVPVFVDVEIPTYNVRADLVEEAVGPRTRAIALAHTLGNPFDLAAITEIARRRELYLIEDCCDALGATYQDRKVGSFGDLATLSFYPAHHITTGEGGAVLTDSGRFRRIVESLRDWGRDCWCAPGRADTCGKRFAWKLGGLPRGYDHKYTYTHLGYNLKLTDLQAAVGVAQLERLDDFVAARRRNFQHLHTQLAELEEHLVLPAATPGSDPSWFGYPLCVRPEAPFERNDLVRHLEARGVHTRPLFAGNLLRQPYLAGREHRVVGPTTESDRVAEAAFWIGLFPGLGEEHLDHAAEVLRTFCTGRTRP